MIERLHRDGKLVALERRLWTTREIRELEQRTLHELLRRGPMKAVAPVRAESTGGSIGESQRQLGVKLSEEQERGVEVLTGPDAAWSCSSARPAPARAW